MDGQSKYNQLVNSHGELYEKKSVPMSDDERKHVVRFYDITIVFASVISVGLFSVTYYFNKPDTTEEYVYMTGFVAFFIYVFVLLMKGRKKSLGPDSKSLIKGVVTNRIQVKHARGTGHDYYVEVSLKEEIQVSPAEFEKCEVDDIVEIEVLGSLGGIGIKRKVNVIGKNLIEDVYWLLTPAS